MSSSAPGRLATPIVDCIRVEDGIFWFDFNEGILRDIERCRQREGTFLRIPHKIRTWLRKATLFDISAETARKAPLPSPPGDLEPAALKGLASQQHPLPPVPFIQSGLTFISCYQETPVLQTIVGLDGDVMNKVQQNFLLNPSHRGVTQCHFWMIDQLLLALRQESDRWLNLATGFGIALPVGASLLMSGSDGVIVMEDAIATLVGSGLSLTLGGMQRFWKPYLQQGILRVGWYFIRRQMK